MKIEKIEIIEKVNEKLGKKLFKANFRKLKGVKKSYVYSFSWIKDIKDIFSDIEPEKVEKILNKKSLSKIIDQGIKFGYIDYRYSVINLGDNYSLLVDMLEYEAIKGDNYNEEVIYNEAS
jgi:hypothetical protein